MKTTPTSPARARLRPPGLFPFVLPAPGSAAAGALLMLASVVFFAANTLLVKFIGDRPGADSWVISAYRYGVGLGVAFLVFRPRGGLSLRRICTRPLLAARGIFGGIGIPIFYITVIELGAGRATIIGCTYPLFGTLLAAVFLRERVTLSQVAWFVVACVGTALVAGVGGAAGFGFYDGLAVFGAFVAGCVVVTIRKLHASEPTANIFGAQCVYGMAIAAVPASAQMTVPGPGLFALLVAGAILVAFGQILMTQAYKALPVSRGSAFQLLLPVCVAAGGYVFFGERFTLLELAGAALVLLSCSRIVRG